MKFMVLRTSCYDGKPCDEAVLESFVRVDERTTDSPDKIPFYAGKPTDWWYSDGRNHRIENGHICRDFDAQAWFIEIPDLAALMAFAAQHGDIVIKKSYGNRNIDEIEIYDDYCE